MAGGPCPICQCRWGSTDCIHFPPATGAPDDPFIPTLVADPGPDNFIECAPGGLAVLLPPEIIDPPCVHATSTIDQTIATEAEQILFFNENRYDTDSMHETENAPSRLTFKTPGVYDVTVNILWDKNTDGDRALYIRKNSGEYLDITSIGEMGLRVIGMNANVVAYFEAGDYVEALVKHDAFPFNSPKWLTILSQRNTPNFSAMYMRQAP